MKKKTSTKTKSSCSATHVGMWIRTKAGNSAHILADPKMKKETLDALATMIDAAYKAAVAGTLKPKSNA